MSATSAGANTAETSAPKGSAARTAADSTAASPSPPASGAITLAQLIREPPWFLWTLGRKPAHRH